MISTCIEVVSPRRTRTKFWYIESWSSTFLWKDDSVNIMKMLNLIFSCQIYWNTEEYIKRETEYNGLSGESYFCVRRRRQWSSSTNAFNGIIRKTKSWRVWIIADISRAGYTLETGLCVEVPFGAWKDHCRADAWVKTWEFSSWIAVSLK